jgi:hypothetical protein
MDCVGNSSHPLIVDVGSDDSRTLCCKAVGNHDANPRCGPCDEGNLFGQVSVPHRFRPLNSLPIHQRKVRSGHADGAFIDEALMTAQGQKMGPAVGHAFDDRQGMGFGIVVDQEGLPQALPLIIVPPDFVPNGAAILGP